MGSGTSKPAKRTPSSFFKSIKKRFSSDGGSGKDKSITKQHPTADGPTQKSNSVAPPAPVPASSAAEDVSQQQLGHISYQDGKYRGAPMPPNESERHAYLCGLNVLDTPPDPKFDEITKLATAIFKVPICLVSLVDKERQWFKSVVGLTTDNTDRQSSFCAWTLLPEHPEVLVVPDATVDARFKDNKLVTGPPDIRFYAGCPLVTSNGLRMGSLCIIDRQPRVFDAESCMMLTNLGQMVVRELEKDKLLEEQKIMSAALTQENTQLLRAIDAFSEGIMLCNVSEQGWPVEFINDAWEQLTGFSKELIGNGFWSFFRVDDKDVDKMQDSYRKAIDKQMPFEMSVYFVDSMRQKRNLVLQMRCANLENMDSYMPLVGIPSMLPDASGTVPTYYFATLTTQQANGGTRPSSSVYSLSAASHESGTNSGFRNLLLLGEGSGDPFGDVQLGQLLGRGSYGRVYRGKWNGATVAVKVLEYEQGEGTTTAAGASDCKEQVEALLSTQLSHPNVVQTFKHCSRQLGVIESTEQTIMETWMVMEFCNRGSLADAVDRGEFRKRDNMFEINYAAFIATAKEVASAMCYLHSRRILHGDLTANNVLLTGSQKDGRGFVIKVADFGLSRSLEGIEKISTKTMGTVTHMPPELMLEGHQTLAADVYAFGVIMWEMYMGQRPWMGLSHGQIIHAITSGKQLQLGSTCPTILRKFITKCMSRKPEDRPTFMTIIKDLDELEEELIGMVGDL